MASGEQTRKPRPKQDDATEAEAKTAEKTESADEVDELLDEIDEVLEVNAEEFVRGFIQKGGE